MINLWNMMYIDQEHQCPDIKRFTDCCGTVVHPQRLLHEGAKQHFAVTYGARLYVHHEAKGSVSVVVPLKVVRSDLCTT